MQMEIHYRQSKNKNVFIVWMSQYYIEDQNMAQTSQKCENIQSKSNPVMYLFIVLH